jgi:MFS family permease
LAIPDGLKAAALAKELEMLNGKAISTVALAALGAMLEYYDFVIFLFVAAAISETFFPPGVSLWIRQMQTFGIFAVGYLVRPVAGILLSHFSDMVSRKKMFIFLLALMAVPTFLIGILPTYEHIGVFAPIALLALRVLQGCAVGGELPGASVFVSEHAAPSTVGFAGASLQSIVAFGLLLGTGVASLSVLVAEKTTCPSLAWRLPFLIGGVFGMTAAYLRRHLEESPLHLRLKQSGELAKDIPAKIVLVSHTSACLFGMGLTFSMACGSAIFFQYLPTLLITVYGIPKEAAFNANIWGTLAYALAMPVWGRMSDRFGWGRTLGLGAFAMLAASVFFFHMLPRFVANFGSLGMLFAIAGGAVASVAALTPALLSSLFPTSVRQSGYAIPYNVGMAAFAGLMPLTLSWLVREYGPGVPLYPMIMCVFVTACLAVTVRRMKLYLGSERASDQAENSTRRVFSSLGD